MLPLLPQYDPYPPEPPVARSQLYVSADGQTLTIIGGPDAGFTERLKQILDKNPKVSVAEINSGAKGFEEPLASAKLLNERNITLTIWLQCMRGCAYFWAATKKRALTDNAAIGLNADPESKSPTTNYQPISKSQKRKVAFRILNNAGFPSKDISQSLNAPNNSVHWYSAEDLRSLGVKFKQRQSPN